MIPEYTQDEIDRFVSKGIPPGSFVRAVLENDLKMAFANADATNLKNLKDIVQYVYWDIPADCQGSVEKVNKWPQLLADRIARGISYDHWNPA